MTRITFTLGLDLAKDSLVACLLDADGREVKPLADFDTSAAGLRRLIRWLVDPGATRVVFESTGVYGKRVISALDGAAVSLHQLNPRIVKHRTASAVQTKTDQADARAIARAGHDLALTDPRVLEHARVRFDPAVENLALWLGEHHRLTMHIASLRVQIQSLGYHTAPATKALLARRRRELKETRRRKAEAAALMDQAALAADPERLALLRTIPGIGHVAAAAVLCKVGDGRRFESADALKGYLGLYPRRVQSGKHEARARMATHGPALIRHVLWNCAKVAARFNPDCKSLFDRLRAKGKHAASCYGAVARKLVQIVYGVLKNQRPFTPQTVIHDA